MDRFSSLKFRRLTEIAPLDNIDAKRKTITPSKLTHSEDKKVNLKMLKSTEVEITPGQFVELEFPADKEVKTTNQKTSFLLESKGYYMPFR